MTMMFTNKKKDYIYVCIYIDVCMYVCMYIYIYIIIFSEFVEFVFVCYFFVGFWIFVNFGK